MADNTLEEMREILALQEKLDQLAKKHGGYEKAVRLYCTAVAYHLACAREPISTPIRVMEEAYKQYNSRNGS